MSKTSAMRSPELGASSLTHIVQDGLSSTIFVLLPVLAQTFGLSYAQVGLLKAANSASQAVFEFASGWLSERIGEMRLLVTGLVLSAAGYLSLGAVSSVISIAACLLLVGMGTALHHAPSSSLIANSHASETRTSALGLYNASGDVGKLLFTGCFSLCAGLGLAWYQISISYGVLALGAALIVAMIARSKLDTATSGHTTGNGTSATGWGILDWRSFAALLAVTGIDTIVQGGIFVFVSFLMLSKGVSLYMATAATVILLAGGVFGKVGCGFLADRLGAKGAFILVQLLTVAGLIGVVYLPYWLAYLLLMPLGAVAQGSTSITYGFAANLIHSSKMARGYALLYSSGTFAAIAGPLIFGWIADTSSINRAFLLMAAVTLCSIPPMLMLKDMAPKH